MKGCEGLAGRVTWVRWDECPALDTSGYIVEIPYLVQLVRVCALDHNIHASGRFERCEYGCGCVCCGC